MATGTLSDFKIYDPQYQAGVWEGINQYLNVFNDAGRNSIRLVSKALEGQYAKDAFFKNISGIITRRDPTSVSDADAVKLSQDELISVKLNRKIGPIEQTLDSIRKIGKDVEEISFILGQMIGQQKAQDMVNTGIRCAEAAIEAIAAVNVDATALETKTLTTANLVSMLSKFGDRSERLVAWVMHSKNYFDLVGEQLSAKIVNVADRVIYGATPATLNRPVIITDSLALHDDNGSLADTYNVMGLVENAVVLTESEQSELITQTITGKENLILRMQGEYAYNIGLKGFAWDTTGGGVNPTDTALGTSTNWDKVMADVKDIAGVRCLVQ